MALSQEALERIRKNKEKIQNGSLRNPDNGVSSGGATSSSPSGGYSLSDEALERIKKIKEKVKDGSLRNSSKTVDSTYFNSFMRDSQDFLYNAQTSYNKLDYNSAMDESTKSYYDSLRKTESDLRNRAITIRDYLSTNSHQYDEETFKNLTSYLDNFTTGSVTQGLYDAIDYASKFDNAEDYEYSKRAYGYSQKYDGKNADELLGILDTLEDGEEKEWLTDLAGHKELLSVGDSTSQNYDPDFNKYVAQGKEYLYMTDQEYNRRMAEYDDMYFKAETNEERQEALAQMNALKMQYNNIKRTAPNFEGLDEEERQVYLYHLGKDLETGTMDFSDTFYEELTGRKNNAAQNKLQFFKNSELFDDGWQFGDVLMTIGASAGDALVNAGKGGLGMLEGIVDFAGYGVAGIADLFGADGAADTVREGMKWSATDAALGGVSDWLDQASVLGSTSDAIAQGFGQALTLSNAVKAGQAAFKLGKVGSTVLSSLLPFSSSSGLGITEAYEADATDGQAYVYGAIAGLADTISEMLWGGLGKGTDAIGISKGALPFDDIIAKNVSKVFSGRLGKNLAELAVKGGFEGFEEVLAGLGQAFGKSITYMSEKNMWEIAKDENLLEQFIVGAFTGGLMQSVDVFTSTKNDRDLITGLSDSETFQLDTEFQNYLQKSKDEGYELSKKQQKDLYEKVQNINAEANRKSGGSLTGAEVRDLLAANNPLITAEDTKKIQAAAEKRLTELGQTENVAQIAELATKRALGQKLTRSEKSILANSKYGARVANELDPKKMSSGEYTSEWAESIGTKAVNKGAYNFSKVRAAFDEMANAQNTQNANIEDEEPATYKSLEDRIGTEGRFGVSETGKSIVRDTGKEVDIDTLEFKTIEKDKVKLVTPDGTVVDAGWVDWADDGQSYLVSAVSDIENITPESATNIIRIVDRTKPLGPQMNAIDEAFTYGYYNYSEIDLVAGEYVDALTNEQLEKAYELGKAARKNSDNSKAVAYKQMRTAAQAQAEKTASKSKTMTITYNKGNGEVVSIDEAGIKDAKRSGAVGVAKILHKLGLGTRVEFFESFESKTKMVKDRKTGKMKLARVFINDQGVEQIAYSGVYRKSDGTIRVDLNAYNGKGLTLNALAHELTHFIQQWSDKKYKILADFLVKTYEGTDMTMHQRVLREQKRLEDIRGEDVSYDEAFDEVVANAMSKMFDDGKLVERLTELKAQDEKLARKLWEGFKKIMSKFLGIYKNQPALFKDAADLVAMKNTFEQLQNLFAEALVEASDNYQASQQIGMEIDTATESVSPAVMHSEHTWTESDYVQQREQAAKEIAKAIGVSEKKAKDYIDSINSIAKMIAEDRSRLDYFSSPGRTSFVGNVEYGGSFDFSTLCKKRRLLTGTFTAIQKALPNTALTADEILDIRNRMKEANLEVSCGLCYVEGSRANMGQFAKEFLRLYKQYYPDAWQPNMADVNTPDGIEWVRINHPECYEQYEYFWNHYGTLKEGDKNLFASQQKPKLYQLHTEYKGEILEKFKNDDNVEDKNLNGGIRLQSFSDFEIVHLIDTMQIIMDMSRVGLAGQAYTKVPDFAWALGDTGLKINLSLIAKGVDGNGKLIFDDVEGMPIADAMKLRDRYSKNVGTILVAFNDEQLLAAMADERVDFIIPFHRSQWKKSQYEAMGLPAKTKDYTFMQNEKYIKPQFHEYRGRMVKDKATNCMPNEYWDFSKSGKENAEAYLEMCARNNKRPKFYKLLQNNGDGSYSLKADGSTDGYWKLLIDFKMYDNDGNGSPQMPVKPEFNMEEANRMLNEYKGGHSNFPVAQGIVDAFVKDYKESHKGEQYLKNDPGDRFSLYEPVEATNDLLAFHNITEKLLLDAISRNGLLMPSLAVTNKGMNDFGEFSLLFDKSVIDPAVNRNNKLYGSDAWTPMQTSLKMNAKFDTNKTVAAVNAMKDHIGNKYVSELLNITPKQFKEAIIRADGNIYEAYAHNIGVQTAYGMEKGIIPRIPTNKDGTVNKELLQKQLDNTLDTDEGWRQYRRWLNSISDTVITSYDQATNDDVLRHMRAQPATSKKFKLSATGELVVPAVEYSSIKELRRNKNRLSENAEEATRTVAAEFIAFAQKIGDTKQVVEAINAGFEGRYNVATIMKSFRNKGIDLSSKEADKLQALYKRAVELPTQYFEAKPSGVIGLDKVNTAVVPDNTSAEIREALEKLGINVIEYNHGSKESRTKVVNSVENLMFSSQETDLDENGNSVYDGAKKETKQEDKANVTREETREAFYRRAHEKVRTVRERGETACAFNPVTNKTRSARQTERYLKKLGIQVIVHEGLEVNVNGVTRVKKGDATSVAGDVVYVRNSMKTDPLQTAGHEAYHFWKHTDARSEYTDTVVDNVVFYSDAFKQFEKKIEEAYFEEEIGIEDDGTDQLTEEIYAYITGLIHAGDSNNIVRPFLRDYDAVKAAWDDLIKLTSNKKPTSDDDIRYSEHDTDYTNRDLLANAFETLSQNSEEYKLIQQYKGRIKLLNEYEEKLSKLNAEIREIRFGKGKYDAERLAQLEAKAKEMAKLISKNDKKLLSLEASEPLRKVIEQERRKEAQETKAHVQEIQQNKKLRAEQTEYRHKIRKVIRDLDKLLNRGNKKTNVKEDMRGFVSKALDLADYLFTDHVSNDDLIRRGITVRMTTKEEALVKETEGILAQLYDNADSLTDEQFTKLDAQRKRNLEKLRDLLTAQRNERLNTPVYNLFNDLVTEYASLKNSTQEAVKAAYNPEVEGFLRSYLGETDGETDSGRKTLLQNMRVADMTTDELWRLYNAYKMVLTTVRDANKLHIQGKAESIQQVVDAITLDFTKRKTPEGKVATVIRNLSNKIGWDYEKLHYALDRIGSEAFTELVMNIANSENIVMQDVIEAALFRDEMVKKYSFNNWDVNKKLGKELLDTTGKKFDLTLGQLMALYAYSRRDGAWDHIEYGGFVFGEKALTDPRPADSYKLTKDQCEAITNLLTKEQKAYVEDMQKFLSETMGAKGNEVSMQLYGIKMFGEKNYFPIHIAGQYKANAQESQAKAASGFTSMTNAGFTHAQNPNAKAPFVLEGFNEIWADHVNEMSRYHGTVPALEDLRRVMNRSTYSDSTADSMSIQALMENSFGKDAVEYFTNLYREANSGAIRDKLEQKSHKLLSLFRKGAVAYSMSVIVQQPTSIIRAYSMIDKKYFGYKGFGTITSGIVKAVADKWTKAHTNAYNEMLKYAPGVTMAKEIGGFDTHTGGSIRTYLLDTDKTLIQSMKTENAKGKAKAIIGLVDDNAVANLPNLADKIAWIETWNACKRETVAKHKDLATSSEEFMKIVGDRFTEVIRATQVYDSIFAKSPMLKSKSLAVQYLVSFMNEPNTTANMAESAVRDAMRGNWKSGARKAASLIHATIMVAVAKSLIYGMRDDDEDETYTEKFLEAFAGSLVDDFNPVNYIPIAKDVWSVAQGYDVERSDMAVVSDAISALNDVIENATKDTDDMSEAELIEYDKQVTDANWKLVEALATCFGIPVKNIRREIKGAIDHARIASANAGKTTKQSALDKIQDAVIDSIPFMKNDRTKTDRIYDAIVNGDKTYLDRLKSTYSTDTAYQNAVRKALRENDPRIHEAARARYEGNTEEYKRLFREVQKEGNFTFDDIMSAINSEVSKIRSGVEPDNATSAYSVGGFVEAVILGDKSGASTMKQDIIATHIANGKTKDEAEKQFMSDVFSSVRDAYSSGLLNEAGAKKMLQEYAGKDEEESASKVNYWAFCEKNPKYKDVFTEAHLQDYNEFAKPAGISVDMYAKYINGTKGLATKHDKWGDIEVSKRDQVLEVIDSLPITWQQKDALYLAAGYPESKIWDVPW